jgi:tetratricopeptide (TPR) repeat protein
MLRIQVDIWRLKHLPLAWSDKKNDGMKPALVIVIFLLLIGQPACRKRANANANADASGTANANQAEQSQARVYLQQGKDFYRDDQDEKAAEAFQQAIKSDPNLSEGYFRLGLTYDALGKEQEAESSYKKAIEKYKKQLDGNSKDWEAHYNLGQTYAGLKLYNEAVKEYRQATRLKEDDADIYYDLGFALSKLAQYDEAATAFSKSLEIDPENYRAEDALAEAKEGANRIKAGRKHQEELLKKTKKADDGNENAEASESTTPASKSNSNRKP